MFQAGFQALVATRAKAESHGCLPRPEANPFAEGGSVTQERVKAVDVDDVPPVSRRAQGFGVIQQEPGIGLPGAGQQAGLELGAPHAEEPAFPSQLRWRVRCVPGALRLSFPPRPGGGQERKGGEGSS